MVTGATAAVRCIATGRRRTVSSGVISAKPWGESTRPATVPIHLGTIPTPGDTGTELSAVDSSDGVKDTSLKAMAKTKDFKIVLKDPRGRGLVLEDSNTGVSRPTFISDIHLTSF